jgi:hypothetical protein
MPTTLDATSTQGASNFNKVRSAFMQRVSAPNITPFALKLAYVIAFKYMNVKTKLAYPAQETLARDLNVDERTIRRLLDILQPLGLTVIPGNGRGLASTYCLDPERALRGLPERRTPESSFPHQKADSKRRTPETKKGGLQSPPNLTKRTNTDRACLRTPLSAGEREFALSRESESPPSGAGGTADAARAPGKMETATVPPPRDKESGEEEIEIADGAEIEPPSAVVLFDQQRDWRELRALWDRGHPGDDSPKEIAIARNAYGKARAIAEHGEIIAGARVHVAAADAPRYLTALAQWLAARGWEKPPPKKASRGPGASQHQRKDAEPTAGEAFQMEGHGYTAEEARERLR